MGKPIAGITSKPIARTTGKRIIQSNQSGTQPARVYETGSRGHAKTFQAMAAYHAAKAVGKTCIILAKSPQEKMRLIQNHHVDPNDIRLAI